MSSCVSAPYSLQGVRSWVQRESWMSRGTVRVEKGCYRVAVSTATPAWWFADSQILRSHLTEVQEMSALLMILACAAGEANE